MSGFLRLRGALIGIADAPAFDQLQDKNKQMGVGIVQMRHLFCEVQSAGGTTTGSTAAIGTEDTLADGVFLALVLGFVEKTMGNELPRTKTLFALQLVMMNVKVQREPMEGVEIFKEFLHGRHCTQTRSPSNRKPKTTAPRTRVKAARATGTARG